MANELPIILVRTRVEGRDEWSNWVEGEAKLALFYDRGCVLGNPKSVDDLRQLCTEKKLDPQHIDLCAVDGRDDAGSWKKMKAAFQYFSGQPRGVVLSMHERSAVDDEIKGIFSEELGVEDVAQTCEIATYSCGDGDEEVAKFQIISDFTRMARQIEAEGDYEAALSKLRNLLCEWWKAYYRPKSIRDDVVRKISAMKHRFGNDSIPLLGDLENVLRCASDPVRGGASPRHLLVEVLNDAAQGIGADGFEAWVNGWRTKMTNLVRTELETVQAAFQGSTSRHDDSTQTDFRQLAQSIRQKSLHDLEQHLNAAGVAAAKSLDALRADLRRQDVEQLAEEQIETMRRFCDWCRDVNNAHEKLRKDLHDLADKLVKTSDG